MIEAASMATAATQANCGFGSYMLVSAVAQTLMGQERREGQDRAADASERFQEEMQKLKNEHQAQIDELKVQAMRNKMRIDRSFRLEEKFESTQLNALITELHTLVKKEFPLKKDSFPMIVKAIKDYRQVGYGPQVPLNVILLHTLGNIGIDYDTIVDSLEIFGTKLGNIQFRRWCDKDIARNAALFNLHAILGNIPTLVISPFFWKNKIHFTVAMWDAYCETKPLMRPIFSIDCNFEELKTTEGQKALQDKMTLIATAISGCARDSYALLAHGLPPTFPQLLINDSKLRNDLSMLENKVVLDFIQNEYQGTEQALLNNTNTLQVFSQDEKTILLSENNSALLQIQNL